MALTNSERINHRLFSESLYSDIELTTSDDRTLRLHKCILAAASPTLRMLIDRGVTHIRDAVADLEPFSVRTMVADFYGLRFGLDYPPVAHKADHESTIQPKHVFELYATAAFLLTPMPDWISLDVGENSWRLRAVRRGRERMFLRRTRPGKVSEEVELVRGGPSRCFKADGVALAMANRFFRAPKDGLITSISLLDTSYEKHCLYSSCVYVDVYVNQRRVVERLKMENDDDDDDDREYATKIDVGLCCYQWMLLQNK
jgi:hypothetical protein